MGSIVPGTACQRILYIDDDAELAQLFKRMLERIGHRITTQCMPLAALESLSRDPDQFDLVVTDYRMPALDGIEVAKAIHDHHPGLRCAVVSGDVSPHMRESAAAAGIGLVFRKPFTPRECEDLIRQCVA
jgi:CheY-like chemotaxis protein